MTKATAIIAVSVAALGMSGAGEADKPAPLHPVITEVLFNVPPGESGDANKDGTRDSTGDEFIELFNPHGKAINLKGYTITSRLSTGDENAKRGVRFTFPKFELAPGGVVVVFNGYKSAIPGGIGTSDRAPEKANEQFGGAHVFSIQIKQPMLALKNDGDFVLLTSSDGERVACVSWGEPDPGPPSAIKKLDDVTGGNRCSVQRVTADDGLVNHTTIDDRPFSPGEMPATREETPATPAKKKTPDDPKKPATER